MNFPKNDLNDDLSDLIGSGAPVQPRVLPQDEASVRIRESHTESCPKCHGTGKFRGYSGRILGDCFTCKGVGSKTFKTAPAVRAANREQAAERKVNLIERNEADFARDFPAEAAWLKASYARADKMPEYFREMLANFRGYVAKNGTLSTGQLSVIRNGIQRDVDRDQRAQAARQEVPAGAPVVDASKIVEALQRGKASGLIWLTLRFNGIVMSEPKKYPGVLYVKHASRMIDGKKAYLGKIANGRFIASRDCMPEDQAAIVLICEDPLAAAKVYGNVTGSCCVCGRELTNKESIESGIGPICSGRLGWTPGGIRVPVGDAL